MTRAELIDELTGKAADFYLSRKNADDDIPTTMADFAAAMLEREGVYREICEAALRIDFNDANGKYNATVMREPSGNYWAIRLPGNEMKHESDTLEEAYAWVKEGEE